MAALEDKTLEWAANVAVYRAFSGDMEAVKVDESVKNFVFTRALELCSEVSHQFFGDRLRNIIAEK